jgi:hypothetical protein
MEFRENIHSRVLASCNRTSTVWSVSTLRLFLSKHQSAKVLGVVVSFEGTADAGKEETNRKTNRAARGRTPDREKTGFMLVEDAF